jgi:hypothetical protein
MGDERAIFDFPCVGVFLGFFPAVEGLGIEKLDEAFLEIGREERLGGSENGYGSKGEKQFQFHVTENKEDEKLAQAILDS